MGAKIDPAPLSHRQVRHTPCVTKAPTKQADIRSQLEPADLDVECKVAGVIIGSIYAAELILMGVPHWLSQCRHCPFMRLGDQTCRATRSFISRSSLRCCWGSSSEYSSRNLPN